METGWALRFRTAEEDGSPVQAWLFYFALVPFPLWFVGAVWRVPQTRVVGGTDNEKAVPLDDPQVEFGASFVFVFLFGLVREGSSALKANLAKKRAALATANVVVLVVGSVAVLAGVRKLAQIFLHR